MAPLYTFRILYIISFGRDVFYGLIYIFMYVLNRRLKQSVPLISGFNLPLLSPKPGEGSRGAWFIQYEAEVVIESRPARCAVASNKGEIKPHFVSSACWKLCGILQFLLITGGPGEPTRCVQVFTFLVGSRYFRARCDSLYIGSLLKRETVALRASFWCVHRYRGLL